MKKNILSKIIISVLMLGIFLLPISPSFEIKKDGQLALGVNSNKTIAQTEDLWTFNVHKKNGEADFKITATSTEECTSKRDIFLTSTVTQFPDIYSAEGVGPCVQETVGTPAPPSDKFISGCGLFTDQPEGIIGCVAALFYLAWEVSALVAELAGRFLDYLIYYSTDSDSYTSNFIGKGWGAVRDIANIFFIVALLYIAIKTILSLNVTDNKKMIGTIIIVALLINFSLFFTQVIIDASNILAKVFYNNITSKNPDGSIKEAEKGGEKSISVGLVDKFDPHTILDNDAYKNSQGTFIFITILLIAITLYTAYIFFTVGLLFVSRVVMLWFCMIFAPIAFASYTLPFDIQGLGHKEWWKNLFDNAFLAPIFIFMLYLIVMFGGFLKDSISYSSSENWMIITMSKVVPFIILSVLLMKAKEIAVKYAGEMGSAMVKAGQMVGGVALGATAGVAAFAGRAGLGRVGNAIANSGRVKKWESEGRFGAATLRNIGKTAGKGSFDVRGIKVMGKDLSSTGMSNMKAGGEGGFEKRRAEKTEKRKKRADELKVGPDEEVMQEQNRVEVAHQDLLMRNGNAHEIEQLDKKIKTLSDRSSTASRDSKLASSRIPGGEEGSAINTATGNTFAEDARMARQLLSDANGERMAIKNATMFLTSDNRIIDHRTNTVGLNGEPDGALSGSAKTGIENTQRSALAAVQNTAIARTHREATEANAELINKQNQLANSQAAATAARNAVLTNTNPNNNAALTAARDAANAALVEATQQHAAAAATANTATTAEATTAADTRAQAEATIAASNAAIATAALDAFKATNAATAARQDPTNVALAAAATAAENTARASAGNVSALAAANPANIALAQSSQAAADSLNRIADGLTGRSINRLEDEDIPQAHHHVEETTKNRQRAFAEHIRSNPNKVINWFVSGGQHSSHGADEAAHSIRMGAKLDSGHGGKGEH